MPSGGAELAGYIVGKLLDAVVGLCGLYLLISGVTRAVRAADSIGIRHDAAKVV
jgi:hypothetical protein